MRRLLLLTVCVATGIVMILSCSKSKPVEPSSRLPVVGTSAVTAVTRTGATCGGNVLSDGGASVTARGVCWSRSTPPSIADHKTIDGSGLGMFSSSLTGLAADSTYHVCAYATNSVGTAYGTTRTFSTATTVTDYDGNVYATVAIGSQIWMAENLRVTHYRNGTEIPHEDGAGSWANLATGAWCSYNNDDLNLISTYGRLYNEYAVADTHNIAPTGWHVPSDAEWQELIDSLGGDATAGGKLKEAGPSHWNDPNTGATNESGFLALPGGYRNAAGSFAGIGDNAYFWSSTAHTASLVWYRYLSNTSAAITRPNTYRANGFSVRCVKD
jgi:uncharacterized protein (TIGR02145 family)